MNFNKFLEDINKTRRQKLLRRFTSRKTLYIFGQRSISASLVMILICQLVFAGIFYLVIPKPDKAQAASAITAFSYKKQITFNTTATGAAVTTSQTNFPVAIHINTSSWPTQSERDNFFDTNTNGKRIQFFDSNQTTNLDYEVEYFSNAKVIPLSSFSVEISWQTNHRATTKVNYGLTREYDQELQDTKKVREHKVILTGLKPDTEYHYEVLSQNKNFVYDADRVFRTPQLEIVEE